jgi:hypothetical protein
MHYSQRRLLRMDQGMNCEFEVFRIVTAREVILLRRDSVSTDNLIFSSITNKMQRHTMVFLTTIVSELEQLTHDGGKKQKKLDKYAMPCTQF